MGPNGQGRRTPPPGSGVPAHPASQPLPGPRHRGPGVEVRPATDADAPACAALHASQISQGFLSVLGPGFLRRLYRRINRAPHSFLLIAAGQGTTAGFIAGSRKCAPCTGALSGTTGSRPPCRRPAPSSAVGPGPGHPRARHVGHRGRARSRAPGRGRRPGLAGPWCRAHAGRGVPRRGRGPRPGRRPCGGRGGQPRRLTLYQRAGFVTTKRFELHAGTESLLMQWDRSIRSTAGRCRSAGGILIAAVALVSRWWSRP